MQEKTGGGEGNHFSFYIEINNKTRLVTVLYICSISPQFVAPLSCFVVSLGLLFLISYTLERVLLEPEIKIFSF